MALVGESGCGKSTLSRCVVGLYEPTAGEIRYGGEVLKGLPTRAQRRSVQMIFQDPYSSLNPRMTVGQTLGEILRYHRMRMISAAVNKKPGPDASLRKALAATTGWYRGTRSPCAAAS